MTVETEATAPETGAEQPDAPAKAATVEDVARDMGWKSPDEWKGDPPEGGHLSAADFIKARGSKVDTLAKEIAKTRREAEKRIERLERQSKAQREREIADLHKEYDFLIKKAAKEGNDGEYDKLLKAKVKLNDRAEELDGEEDDKDGEKPLWLSNPDKFVEQFEPSSPALQKAFWKDHAWALDDDADLEAFRLVDEYVSSGVPLADAFEKADRALRKAYPDRYEDDMDGEEDERPARKRAPVLASGSRGNGGHASYASRLTSAQREIGNRFVKEGLFGSLEEYAEDRLKDEA